MLTNNYRKEIMWSNTFNKKFSSSISFKKGNLVLKYDEDKAKWENIRNLIQYGQVLIYDSTWNSSKCVWARTYGWLDSSNNHK